MSVLVGEPLIRSSQKGSNIVADESQDSLASRGALLEEIDDPWKQAPVSQVARSDLEVVPLNLLVDNLVVRRERPDPRHMS